MTSKIRLNPMLTVGEVAQLLHTHTNTVRRWADRGLLRAYRISYRGDRRFRRDDITLFRNRLQENSGNAKNVNMEWQ